MEERHVKVLIWKSYLQRQRRWPILVFETLFAGIFFVASVFIAKPVFLTPIMAEPTPPLTAKNIMASLKHRCILGYAPNVVPFNGIMKRTADMLNTEIIGGESEDDLNNILYRRSRGTPLNNSVIWIIWQTGESNVWKFSIKSTERARLAISASNENILDQHIGTGFLGIQMAVSTAILQHASTEPLKLNMSLVSMPISPLMQQTAVKRAIAEILLCFTLAFLPPILEVQALVVTETVSRFKRALCMRSVSFASIHFGWLMYAYFTALPICLLAGITLILIFRWIHLIFALITVLAYMTILIMLVFIMAMFHSKAWIACAWTTLLTLMQTFLSELLVYHKVNIENLLLNFALQMVLPPLGLVHTFNEFALLQTKHESNGKSSLIYPILSWSLMITLYFAILMMLQRTVGYGKAIGGQVSWKSIVFKKGLDLNELHRIETPTGMERDKLQEVDELVAKAISFRNVSKTIMKNMVLSDVTFDIYRGEFTMIFADRVQRQMIVTIEDLLTGLTFPDKGSINMLGMDLNASNKCMNLPYMSGYCHSNETLITDLTVEEHLTLYLGICLWYESTDFINEYSQIRLPKLLSECDLSYVKKKKIKFLDDYYQAQLCWAIALLLEPRIIILHTLPTSQTYDAVIKDKIMRYKKYMTIVKFCFASIKLEYADRVFLFDSKVLVFGGTPGYLFFKFGKSRIPSAYNIQQRKFRKRVTAGNIAKAHSVGAQVRANLGTLLILKLPTTPTSAAAALVKDLTENSERYGIMSMNISVPDSEEVCNRAINDVRVRTALYHSVPHDVSRNALDRIAEFPLWKRKESSFITGALFRSFGLKYYTFYTYYKMQLLLMLTIAAVTGVVIGLSLSNLLVVLEKDHIASTVLYGHLLTVESTKLNTTLVLHLDNSTFAISVANSYVQSETNATQDEVDKMCYTALTAKESLKEYLVTRAIDAPQEYVKMFAYGMEVTTADNISNVRVLYSPMHYDNSAAPRSLARAFTALLRHYTGVLDATIQVTDNPLALDLTCWLMYAAQAPLLTQFMLILTICHITLMPSKEHGLVRHTQCHTRNFSPIRYWLIMFIYDLMIYSMLVAIMTTLIVSIIYLVAPSPYYQFEDFAILPLLLFVYGVGCIPLAYVFSLGPQAALNSMIFVITNIVIGETSIIAKVLYGLKDNYILQFISFSPTFNMAYAYSKIQRVFLYNMECVIFKTKNLCLAKTLHKCCEKCGVLQKCFKKKSYLLNTEKGVFMELAAIIAATIVFFTILILWEYKYIQRLCLWVFKKIFVLKYAKENEALGVQKEKADAIERYKSIRKKSNLRESNFGEYLLAVNVTKECTNSCTIRNVYFGIERGQVLALSGLISHGRLLFCELLAGYRLPREGQLWALSTWELTKHPHKYASQVAFCSDRNPLPPWMTIFDALKLIAILRGVPKSYAKSEVMNFIDALELQDEMGKIVGDLQPTVRTRVHFAAALVGAPPILVLDEFTAYQKFSLRRAMYFILRQLTRRGHAVYISSSSVESHMPLSSRLAILVNGLIYDLDKVDLLVARYSKRGFTVVLHLKDDINVKDMLNRYFTSFVINEMSDVLVNIQVPDNLNWMSIFETLERLLSENQTVYSYIVSAIPVDYVYNWILTNERRHAVKINVPFQFIRKILPREEKIRPNSQKLDRLIGFEQKYNMTTLKELPWSVIFQR